METTDDARSNYVVVLGPGFGAAPRGRRTGIGGTVLGHVHLHVGDIQRADAFYHQALGLDRTVWSYPGALFLSAGGYHHHLGLNTWAGGAPPARGDEARLLDWELIVPAEVAVARARESLVAAGHPVKGTGNSWVARDPWGTAVRVRAEPDTHFERR